MTLDRQFQEIVRKMPEKVAIQQGETAITYKQLNRQANAIARFFQEQKLENKRIVLFMDRSPNLIGALLGVLRWGGIFVPVDLKYPEKRIQVILEEVQSQWIVLHSQELARMEKMLMEMDKRGKVLVLDPENLPEKEFSHLEIHTLGDRTEEEYPSAEEKFCYIYFTSGSTGRPKGILGRQKSLQQFIEWEVKEFGIDKNYRVSQFTTPAFDPFLRDLFVPLTVGGTVCIPEEAEILLNAQRLVDWIDQNEINLIHMVPTLFKNMVKAIENDQVFSALKYVMLAGEQLRGNDIRPFVDLFGDRIQLVNLYGATETTLVKVFYRIPPEVAKRNIIPVGKPIEKAQVLVLDQYMHPCDPGITGEVYIRTPYISGGYFNQPEMTKEVFIRNAFGKDPRDIIYKTGDLGRFLPDGNLEIVGRIDHQVKIRGVRIELGEIENKLLNHPEIQEAVVVDLEEEGEKYLSAYLVTKTELSVSDLRHYLKGHLPDYMIPSYFVLLDALPQTDNGKIDRKALPAPDLNQELGVEYVAPGDEIEEKLAEIWSQILKREKIGVLDNFFDLGGHSLKGNAMALKIYEAFQVNVPLRILFNQPTIKEIADYIRAAEKMGTYDQIQEVEKKDYYPLSSAQRRLFVLDQLEDVTTSYNLPAGVMMQGRFNKEKLKDCFNQLIQRHESLRTSFHIVDGEPMQKIHPEVDFQIKYLQASESEFSKLAKEFVRPFNLQKAPLFRVEVIEGEEKSLLLTDLHHIIADGTSKEILTAEFFVLYYGEELPELKLQYKDYASWQNEYLTSPEMKAQEEYWLEQFAGNIPVLNLPTDYSRPPVPSYEGDLYTFHLTKEMTDEIKTLVSKERVTLFMYLMTIYTILLSKYSGQDDIVVGTPTAGRQYPNLENALGIFINSLAVRSRPEQDKNFREYLLEMKEVILAAFDNQEYQFDMLVEKLDLHRDISRNPLFDTIFVLQNLETADNSRWEELQLESYHVENKISKFDISVHAREIEEKVYFGFEYSIRLFNEETIARMGKHYQVILEQVLENPEITIGEISLLTTEDQKKLLEDFNQTQREMPIGLTLQEIFLRQVKKTPQAVAAVYGDESLTYEELATKSGQLARILQTRGVQADTVVSLVAERSLAMLIGIFGILQAGGAYLPISPDYPAERINYLLKDSGSKHLLVQEKFLDKAPWEKDFRRMVLNIDDESIYTGDATPLFETTGANNLAYLMYTSGSTGQPKGVMLEHQAIVTRLEAMQRKYPLDTQDILLQKTPFTFDVSVLEIFRWMYQGSSIAFLEPGGEKEPVKLLAAVEKYGVTELQFVPSLLNVFLDYIEEVGVIKPLASLKKVFACGEALLPWHVEKFNALLGVPLDIELVNLYGPTEAAVYATTYDCPRELEISQVPIGKPIDHVQAYILDDHLELMPIGIPGELCLGGLGLARGYYQRDELTAEKFIDNPYGSGRIYRTGDLARWLPNGQIEFLGRIDQQVKIRGFRIEPGEVETVLLGHPEIREVAVVAREDQKQVKYLSAYLTSDQELTVPELRAYLNGRLPEYMVPSYFSLLEEMPLNSSGKVDKQALPAVEGTMNLGSQYVAPENETEEKLAAIWSELLGKERVGRLDHFFHLGGHSLKAIRMLSLVAKEFKVQIPLRQVFANPTLTGLAQIIANASRTDLPEIIRVEERESYPASSAQSRLYILSEIDEKSIAYNMPYGILVKNQLDVERLQQALDQLVKRHEALRTSFFSQNGEIRQRVQKDVTLEIQVTDVAAGEELEGVVKGFLQPFDLGTAPLFRVGLGQTPGGDHLLMIDMHHIISDGVSMEIIIGDLLALYAGQKLAELPFQYRDFAIWQNQLFASERMEKQEQYWLGEFAGQIPVLDLPTDFPRPSITNFAGDTFRFKLEPEVVDKVHHLARELGLTPFMVYMAAYYITLAKYTGQEDLVVGTPTAGRQHADLENIVGVFINTLAIRMYPEEKKLVRDYLLEVKEKALGAYENQDYQFEMLVEKLDIKRDLSRNPLFDVMLTYHTRTRDSQLPQGFEAEPIEFSRKMAKFDLSLDILEEETFVALQWEYSTQLFKEETIERLAQHFVRLLDNLTENPDREIGNLEMLSDEERHQLMVEFNDNDIDFPREREIYQLFEDQVKLHPEKVALEYGEIKRTYRQVNERANQIARLLQDKGLEKEDLVAIMFERSPLMVEAILGVWKAGGAYIPIDADYPPQRIQGILEDSNTKVLLTKSWVVGPGPIIQTPVLKGEAEAEVAATLEAQVDLGDFEPNMLIRLDLVGELLDNLSGENLDLPADPDKLAYVIYTSGSTGKPKGAMVEQVGMMNHIQAKVNDIEVTEESIVVQNASHCFDISVWQYFVALVKGGKTVIYDNDLALNPKGIFEQVRRDRVTVLEVVPSFLNVLLDVLELKTAAERELPDLAFLLVTGETLKPNLVQRWFELYSEIPMVNAYGPTEASDDITHYIIDRAPELHHIPVGKPIQNFNIYILNDYHRLCPIGVKGEICVAGIGVGRGYLNNPEKTNQVFMEDPFEPGVRMYKTGDLGRFMPDGNIQFFGRKDYQVKIRGYRIELGEIENVLIKHPQVKETVVVDRSDEQGNKYLCAYLAAPADLSINDVKKFLGHELPDYMIPAYFVILDELPLTPNGKIDRKALPEPELTIERDTAYQAPRNPVEETLAKIWSEVLGIKEISILDNFFELGGHSLKATTMIAQVFKEMQVEIPLREVFKNPTIAQLAALIQETEQSHYASIERLEEREYYPVSSAQKRLFVLREFDDQSTNYNMPGAVVVEGKMDQKQLEWAFKELIQRHEALRTSFDFVDKEPVQRIHQEVDFALRYISQEKLASIDVADGEEKIRKLIQAFVEPFDLSKAPLLRVAFVELAEEKYLLLYDMHHIISDGRSMDILIEELMLIYNQVDLEPLRIQYRDFAAWQNEFFASEELARQKEYWVNLFQDEIPVLNMPTDYKRPREVQFAGDRLHFQFNKDVSAKLKEMAQNEGATLYMALLAAINILLYRYTGQEDIVVGSPIAGRNHADLQNIIGMFVNTLPMRNQPKGEMNFRELLTQVRTNALQAYENQDYQFEMLVESLDLQRDQGRNPLFDVVFVLQNAGRGQMASDEAPKGEMKVTPYDFSNRTAKFDMTFNATEAQDGIHFTLEYSTRLFKASRIERLAKHLIKIVEEVTGNPELPLAQVEMIGEGEKERILTEFNDSQVEYPRNKTVQEIFEEIVRRRGDVTALSYDGETLTYRELNRRANNLARRLRARGVMPNQSVGIMVEYSLEMIIGVLAIIKAGGAYLPINLDYPKERIEFMLEDADAQVLLSRIQYAEKLDTQAQLMDLSEKHLYSGVGDENPMNLNRAEDLIYIMYTSGSTGQPKGVMVEHRNVNRLIINSNMLTIRPEDRILQTGSLAFDASTFEIWGALLNGATLYLVDKAVLLSPEELEEFLKANRISVIWVTGPLFNQMLDENPTIFNDLRMLFTGGDVISPWHVNLARKQNPDLLVTNGYGPTEGTTFTTYFPIKRDYKENIPIGKPVSNTKVYILDQQRHLQPIGVPGELCIGGDGVAQGYLNRPDLTQEKFIEDPFNPGGRMYLTGDLVCWAEDGNIEFLSRIDHQVKIRGFRIEPAEIEVQLLNHPLVDEAAVIVKSDEKNRKYLVAYYVPQEELAAGEVRNALAVKMPDYMIPSYFIKLEKMPLNVNGKVDRAALPEPTKMEVQSANDYVPPANEVEEKLAAIWAEVLEIDQVGVTDDFFDLGGHSLKLISTQKLINQEFGVKYSIGRLFKYPTVREFALSMERELATKDLETVIPIRMGSGEKNIFCIHPLGGAIHWYKDFAENFDESYNIYGIQARGMMDDSELPKTVEEMVGDYLEEMREVQPEGPYIITAFCAGSMLAYEMTRQLEAEKAAVDKCILLDSAVFRHGFKRFQFSALRKISKVFAAQEELKEAAGSEVSRRQKEIEQNILEIMMDYKAPNKIESDIHLFVAEKTDDPKKTSAEAWSPLTEGEVIEIMTPGDHFSMMEMPLVREVTGKIEELIE